MSIVNVKRVMIMSVLTPFLLMKPIEEKCEGFLGQLTVRVRYVFDA